MKKREQSPSDILSYYDDPVVPKCADIVLPIDFPELTGKQVNVLKINMLPQASTKSVLDKCAMAGVSPRYWYNTVRNPKFQAASIRLARALFGHKVWDIWHAYIRKAIHGSADFMGEKASQERILEQIGVLDKAETPKSGDTVVNITLVEQKRQENIAAGLHRFGYAIDTEDEN